MEISKNAIALAGEFAVLSQLYMRGFDANLTLGNTKRVDILASYPDLDRMFKLEVKTSFNGKPSHSKMFGHTLSWVMSKKHESITDPNLFYCFVNIARETNRFDFYIVPSAIVADYVRAQHQYWLDATAIDHRKGVDTDIRRFRLGVDETEYSIETPLEGDFENNWEILLR